MLANYLLLSIGCSARFDSVLALKLMCSIRKEGKMVVTIELEKHDFVLT